MLTGQNAYRTVFAQKKGKALYGPTLITKLGFFTSKDPKNSIPVNAIETQPKESLSADLSVIIEAKLIEARFVQNTHLKRIRRNSLRRPRT